MMMNKERSGSNRVFTVAIAHEWLDQPGGAENVLRQMLEVVPDADVWSLWALNPAAETIPAVVQSTWLASTPLVGRKMAALPLMPFAWRTLPRRDYDVVITSSYALAHTAKFRGRGGPTLHYVHTPARYWWTPEVDNRASGRMWALPRAALRSWDRRLGRLHTHVAANSVGTQRRIEQFWEVPARVIYPPVDTNHFAPGPLETHRPFPEYVLGVSRWVSYKRLDLVIRTAEEAGIPAVIAGSGPMEPVLRDMASLASVPVHFEISPDQQRLRDLYRGALALVFPAHEDFGIVPVEAMACGTPVVGPAVGGLLESIGDGVSGVLVADAHPRSLADGLTTCSELDRGKVRGSALRFSQENFRESFRSWIGEVLA